MQGKRGLAAGGWSGKNDQQRIRWCRLYQTCHHPRGNTVPAGARKSAIPRMTAAISSRPTTCRLRYSLALLIFRADVIEEVEAQFQEWAFELFRQRRIGRCAGDAAPCGVIERHVAGGALEDHLLDA